MFNIKDIIRNKAKDTFLKYGFKSVTMDDLSKELAMSKKTLYQYFPNKENLMQETLEELAIESSQAINKVMKESMNPIDKLFWFFKFHLKQSQSFNHQCVFDLKKYYPKIWDKVNMRKQNNILKGIVSNLEEGIALGLYRDSINIKVIAQLFYLQTRIFEEDELSLLVENREILIYEFIQYHLNGICTEQGKELINTYTEKYFNRHN